MNTKYKVGKGEDISNLPYGATILNAKIVFKDEDEALIYFPRTVKYEFEGNVLYDKGDCGSLSFAVYDEKCWIRSENDYMNISLKRYEK